MKQRFRVEKLEVWQDARALYRTASRLAREFPKDEMYGLTPQVRRASSFVVANIAEGYIDEADLDPVLEQASVLAGRLVAPNHSLVVTHTKTPFSGGAPPDARPSSLVPRLPLQP
jgi:hypothetical protein